MHKQNWDDLRFVLTVAETGSVSRAATRLGVTHATVLRRVAAFEERHGAAFFRRTQSGYTVLPEMQPVLEAAQEVEHAVLTVERMIKGTDMTLKGQVRITSTDSLCLSVLPAALTTVAARYPDLKLILLSGNNHLDLERMAADITIRPARQLDDRLVGVKAADMQFAVYQAMGQPALKWLSLEGALARSDPAEWIAQNVAPDEIASGADSFMVLAQLVRLGAGRSFLPVCIGDATPGLERVIGPSPNLSVPIWVAASPEMADTLRISAVMELLAADLAEAMMPAT